MLSRICFAIKGLWQYRRQLRRFLQAKNLSIETIADLNPEYIIDNKIGALALDFDGVLAPHGNLELLPEAKSWLDKILAELTECRVFILSNNPYPKRQEYFKHNYPQIHFVVAKRKKPYPDGIEEILALAKLRPEQLLLVDDRLATGILAAIICGVRGLWVYKPYVNLCARPIKESFFIILRAMEKGLLWLLW